MALGRGLSAILNEVTIAYDNEMDASTEHIKYIPLGEISLNPFQPRKYFEQESLKELAKSIKYYGLLQPIVVIKRDEGYLLIAGERRLRAHKLAGLETIKAIVADVNIDNSKLQELALVENIQRENLNPMELAQSYNELLKVYQITHDELSNIVHKSRSQITNTLRLLNLSTYVQNRLIDGSISQGHAKILVGFDENEQRLLVDRVISQKLSVKEIELLVKTKKDNLKRGEKGDEIDKSFYINSYRETLRGILPFPFKLKNNSIEIKFKDKSEIETFLEILKK